MALGLLPGCSFGAEVTPVSPTPAPDGVDATPRPERAATPTMAPTPSKRVSSEVSVAGPTESPAAVAPQVTPTPSASPTSRPGATGGQSPTASPSPSPAPTPTPEPPTPNASTPGLSVYTGQVSLPTYPYVDYLRVEQDPVYGLPIQRLDRTAYQAASPRPSPTVYETLVVENAYLRLAFLPKLGGRLYSAVVKSTGQEIFYHNPVIKPSRYGPLLPLEDNWWLAAGGMEWAFPVEEHGYAWGQAWTYDLTYTDRDVTVTLRDSTQPGRIRAEVRVTLAANRATFVVQPRLINGTDRTLPVQFWLNAALSPGAPSVPPDTQFILPVNQVLVHSRGDAGWDLPGPRSPMPWPVVAGRDLGRYDQWSDHLGFFMPDMPASFAAVYNPAADLGVARLVPPGQIPGHKLFAFGLNFADRSYTDDDSQYVELWGGANRGFWPEDDIQLPAGGAVEWRETWWPLSGLGGLTFANDQVAFNLQNGPALRILSARPGPATLIILADGVEISRASLTLSPIRPVEQAIPAPEGAAIQIQILGPGGDLMADYPILSYPVGTSP